MHFEDQFDAGLPKHCEGCWQRRRAGREVCWLCGRHTVPEEAARQVARYVPPFASNSWWQFSIKSLMVLTALVSVLSAFVVADPVLGVSAITLVVLGIPALMRTCSLNNRYLHATKDLPLDIRVRHFMVSAGIYMMIGLYCVSVGAFLVFFASSFLSMCAGAVKTPSLVLDVLQTSSFALPIMVSLGLMWILLRESWPTQFLPPTPPQ